MTPTSNAQTTPDGETGLTLLEVLAAAMIFAMVMTVLIGTSTTAVHRVGVSARRLEANLVADGILSNLEIQMKQRSAPEVDDDESILDPYTIRVVRRDLFQDPEAAPSDAAGFEVASMLGAELPEVAKHMKQYDIEVSWFEQSGTQSVTRTTFAYDWPSAAIEYADLFERSSQSSSGSPGGSLNSNDNRVVNGRGSNRNGSNATPNGPNKRGRLDGHNARARHFQRLQQQEEAQN